MAQEKSLAIVKQVEQYMSTPEFQDTVMSSLAINEKEFKNSLFLTVGSNPKFKDGSVPVKKIMEGIIRAGRDGLICDGKEAALIPFGQDLQYIPMVAGLIKRAYKSGKIKTIMAEVVYDNDEFDYQMGDKAFINFKKNLKGDRGNRYAAFAIIEMKDGGVVRRIMTKTEIERIRIEFSKAGGDAKTPKGIWAKHTDAQWEKTALRQALKKVPLSSEEQSFFQSAGDDIDLDPINNNDEEKDVTPVKPEAVKKTKATDKLKAKVEETKGEPKAVDAEVVEEEEDIDMI